MMDAAEFKTDEDCDCEVRRNEHMKELKEGMKERGMNEGRRKE